MQGLMHAEGTNARKLGNLYVQILKHSINPVGEEAITWFWTYERMIHAEVLTHRWSRNYSSSRAIPYDTMMKWVSADPANHAHLGSNRAGMQAGAEVENADHLRTEIDDKFREMREWCDGLAVEYDPHKEVLNRYTEPWGWVTGMATMGRRQYMNFIGLRCTDKANPNIQRVAINSLRLYKSSVPQPLNKGEWHTPWFDDYIPYGGVISTVLPGVESATACTNEDLRYALTWSGARSAWCSYNNPTKDATFDKAQNRHDLCISLLHATPLEHQLQARDDGGKRGLVPGYDSYRMMIPGESISEVDIDAVLKQYEGKDYLVA